MPRMMRLFDPSHWSPARRVFAENVRGCVTVDADSRVYVYRQLVSAIYLTEYWHLFLAEIGPDRWPGVVEAQGLPKTVRQTLRSSGLRNGQSRLIGRYPKRPIHIIQEERGKEAGEPSHRVDYRAIERAVKEDLKNGRISLCSEDCNRAKELPDFAEFKDEYPF